MNDTMREGSPFAGRLRRRIGIAALACTAAAITLAVVALRTPLLERGLDVPFIYSEDGLFHLTLFAALAETGAWGDVARLGAPFASTLVDIPMCEATHQLAARALLAFTRPVVAYNLFYLLGFAASAAAATLVARRERLHPALAVAVGVVFALSPYHFLRLAHPFLASYAGIPFVVAAALDLLRGAPRARRALARPSTAVGLAFGTLVVSGMGLYYAFFACALGVFAGVRGAAVHRSLAPMRVAGFFVGLTVVGVAAQLTPNLLHAATEGPAAIGQRLPEESEYYALKPIQLLLPTPGHALHALARIADAYAHASPHTNENASSALGVLGAIGLAIGLGALVLGLGRRRVRAPAFIALVMIAVGTVGGLGAVFAYAVHPGIRSINRVSIVVSFVTALVLAASVQGLVGRLRLRRHALRRAILVASSVVAIGIASFDQVPARGYRPAGDGARFMRDRVFFRRAEQMLPRGSSLLVVPYATFPEGATRHGFGPYEGLRAYLNTRTLRTSAGAMSGRAADVWLAGSIREPSDRKLALAWQSGFDGVLVGRAGLPPDGARAWLEGPLGRPLLANRDWWLFRRPEGSLADVVPLVAHALGRGFLGWEMEGRRRIGSWSAGDAELLLVHAEPRPVRARVTMRVHALDDRRVTFRIGRRTLARVRLRPNVNHDVTLDVTLPRGLTRVALTTDRPARDPGNGDLRDLAFGIGMLRTSAVP